MRRLTPSAVAVLLLLMGSVNAAGRGRSAEPPSSLAAALSSANDKSLEYAARMMSADEAFRLAAEFQRPDLQVEALLCKANVLFEQDSLRTAMDVLNQAKALDPGHGTFQRQRVERRVADLYYRLGAYDRAVQGYAAVRRNLAVLPPDSSVRLSLAHLSVCMGNVHRASGDLEEALSAYREGLEHYRREGFAEGVAGARLNAANVLHDRGRYQEALTEYDACAQEASSMKDPSVRAMALNGAAASAVALGDTARAARYLDAAMAIHRETGRERGMLHSLKTLGDLRMRQARAHAALDAYGEALDLALRLEDRLQIAELYRLRATADSALGFYRDAYADLMSAHHAREEALEKTRLDGLQRLKVAYEVERKEQQISHLGQIAQAREARARLLTAAIVLAVLLLAGISWGLSVELRAARAAREANLRLEEAYAKVEALSITDPLTGLFNRRKALERLVEECERSRRTGTPFAVGMVDLDDFKATNDTRGHEAGDHALKRVAARLAEAVRVTDCVARWGGDEFLMILPETDHGGLQRVMDRLCRAGRDEAEATGFPSCSLGFAVGHGEDPEELLRRADQALYAAKAQGKGRVVVYDRLDAGVSQMAG